MFAKKRKLLSDEPVDEDAFEGGGHKRSAESLARTIEELDDRDAVIGLDGKWGSGKSSVIRIMAHQELKDRGYSQIYHIFTFDLWGNQSQPFRRSFLEKFLEWAGQEPEFKAHQKELNERQRKIGGKIREISSTTHIELTAIGVALALIVPLFPILYAWLSPLASKPLLLPDCEDNFPSGINAIQISLSN